MAKCTAALQLTMQVPKMSIHTCTGDFLHDDDDDDDDNVLFSVWFQTVLRSKLFTGTLPFSLTSWTWRKLTWSTSFAKWLTVITANLQRFQPLLYLLEFMDIIILKVRLK